MANTVDKVIIIADSEVGYLEKKSNKNLDDKTANAGSNNYTKYWEVLASGMNGNAWCNCFVNWCFSKAYGTESAKNLLCTSGNWSYYTPTSAGYFKKKNQWHTSNPKIGDVIYFKNSTRIHHVGLVYKVDSKYVYTIEGNTNAGNTVIANGGGVARKKYLLTNSAIAGYGRPKYDVETDKKMEYYPKCDKSYTTISSALESINTDSSKTYRKNIANANGIVNYTGTLEQNTKMLNLLKNGKLIKP